MVQSAQSTFEVCHEITSYQYQRAELGVMLIDGDLNPVLPAPPAPPPGPPGPARRLLTIDYFVALSPADADALPAASGGLSTAGTVGVAVAGAALVLLAALFGFTRRRKEEKLLSFSAQDLSTSVLNSATRTDLDDLDDAFGTNTGTVVSSVVCRCASQLCTVCNPSGSVAGTTMFLPVSLAPGDKSRLSAVSEASNEINKSQAAEEVVATYEVSASEASARRTSRSDVPLTPTPPSLATQDLNAALFAGNWELVAMIAEELDGNEAAQSAFQRSAAPMPEDKSQFSAIKSVHTTFVAGLAAENEWGLVAEIARDLASNDTDANTLPPPATGGLSDEQAEIHAAQVLALVLKIAPDEADNVEIMMKEFEGRVPELIEQLSAIHERSVAHASRQVSNTLSRKFSCQTTHPPHSQVNQVNAKRAAKKTVKQTRLSSVDNGAERTAVVNVITSGDIDRLVKRTEFDAILARANEPFHFTSIDRTISLDDIAEQKAQLIASLFAAGEVSGIKAACEAFSKPNSKSGSVSDFSDEEEAGGDEEGKGFEVFAK